MLLQPSFFVIRHILVARVHLIFTVPSYELQVVLYSGPSDSGLSEITTLYNEPLYKGHGYFLPIVPICFEPPNIDNLSTKDKA